jgi:hypothetical protein
MNSSTQLSFLKLSLIQQDLSRLIKNNKRFHNLHINKRCFIIGNGPSLNTQDLTLLKNEIIFTVNQFDRTNYSSFIHPNYHFWADKTLFSEDTDFNPLEIRKQMKQFNDNNKTISFYESVGYSYINKYKLYKVDRTFFFKIKGHLTNYLNTNFSSFVSGANTIVQYAIIMALYMGFNEIYLLGCDNTLILNYINSMLENNLYQYSYVLNDKEKVRMKKIKNIYNLESQLLGNLLILRGFNKLTSYAKKKSIKLVNLTPGGLIDNVPRQSYDSIFKKEL